MKRVCVVPGDGIGPEVIGCAVSVLKAATDQIELAYGEMGLSAFEKHSTFLPDSTFDLMKSCDSTLFGAVTSPESSDYESPVLKFRKELELYANVRPIKNFMTVAEKPSVDLVIIRENLEGLYTQKEVYDDQGVTTLRRVTRAGSERIVDFAIEYAKRRGRKSVCCVHKANVLRASDGLFLGIFRERMAARGGELIAREQLVDSAALRLVTDPSSFDVLVTLNLYGDILSDVAAGVVGGLGFAPSGNIGKSHSVFEPAHGSAPDIAGKGVANPTAAIMAASMMLEHLGMEKEADSIRRAIELVYSSGHMTIDIGGRHGSKSFTEHVLRALRGQTN